MDVLAPFLPSRYAPLRSIGTGPQIVYLTRLPEELAATLIDLIGVEARDIIGSCARTSHPLPGPLPRERESFLRGAGRVRSRRT
jgi:hypothetical protein